MEFLGADTEQVMGYARALRDGDERITALYESLGPPSRPTPLRQASR